MPSGEGERADATRAQRRADPSAGGARRFERRTEAHARHDADGEDVCADAPAQASPIEVAELGTRSDPTSRGRP
jgi:hypothetical protein